MDSKRKSLEPDQEPGQHLLSQTPGTLKPTFGGCIFNDDMRAYLRTTAYRYRKLGEEDLRIIWRCLAELLGPETLYTVQSQPEAISRLTMTRLNQVIHFEAAHKIVPDVSAAVKRLLTCDPTWIFDPLVQLAYVYAVELHKHRKPSPRGPVAKRVSVLRTKPARQLLERFSLLDEGLKELDSAFSPKTIGKEKPVPIPDGELFALVHLISGVFGAWQKENKLAWSNYQAILLPYPCLRSRLSGALPPRAGTKLLAIDQAAFILAEERHALLPYLGRCDVETPDFREKSDPWLLKPTTIRRRLGSMTMRKHLSDRQLEIIENKCSSLGMQEALRRMTSSNKSEKPEEPADPS